MEGVAARLGRSSTRYGPAAVFSGPVRRWNKKWVPLSNPDHRRRSGSGGNPHSSNLLLYRWTPVPSLADAVTSAGDLSKDVATPQPEEPTRKKFRYVPISVIEDRKEDSSPKSTDNPKPSVTVQFPRKGETDSSGMKPDMNNVLAEVQVFFFLVVIAMQGLFNSSLNAQKASYKDQTSSEEVNGTDLDLSLGLRASKGDQVDERKTTQLGELRAARASPNQETGVKITKPAAQNKLKRKAANPE